MAGFRDILGVVLHWWSAPVTPGTVVERYDLIGTSTARITLAGTDATRLSLVGTDSQRITLEGTR